MCSHYWSMFPVKVYLIDGLASAFIFVTAEPSCLLHKAGNDIVDAFSIELVDLVDVSSLHLVETAVIFGGAGLLGSLTRMWGFGISLKS